MFLRQRSLDHGHNAIVSLFLRKLEYYERIMFLTTNRVKDFDDAMQSRIHLAVKYPALGVNTRKEIWKSFLEKAVTIKGKAKLRSSELDKLAEKDLNGRQVDCCAVLIENNHANQSSTPDQKCCKSSPCLGVSG